MNDHRILAIILAVTVSACTTGARNEPAAAPAPQHAAFVNQGELKWDKIIPELGAKSPEIAILRVDPSTQATHLMIRTPAPIHVRKHWHTANETHTILRGRAVLECDGQRSELGPGGFNFMPAKMVHEAWLPADTLTLITVDRAWDINWVEGPPTAADIGVKAPRQKR